MATIENAKFNYQPGDAPQATAQVTAADAEKYEIDYEVGNSLKTTNQLPHGTPITARMALCRPSRILKAASVMCIFLC